MSPDRIERAAPRPGRLCLQGGRELTPPCRGMDREVLDSSGTAVAVLAGAARPGSDYAGASERARSHYASLGADVVVVPDPRDDVAAALRVLDRAIDVLVLPGGSPGGLLDVLAGRIGERITELHAEGTAVSGSSAGAMVLCTRTVVPGHDTTAPGLGLAPGLVVPHWTPGAERRWPLDGPDVPDVVWGLPECSGVMLDSDGVRAVGDGEPAVRVDGGWVPVARDAAEPVPGAGSA
jgi:hypothetical protein